LHRFLHDFFIHSCAHSYNIQRLHAFLHELLHAFLHKFLHNFLNAFLHSFLQYTKEETYRIFPWNMDSERCSTTSIRLFLYMFSLSGSNLVMQVTGQLVVIEEASPSVPNLRMQVTTSSSHLTCADHVFSSAIRANCKVFVPIFYSLNMYFRCMSYKIAMNCSQIYIVFIFSCVMRCCVDLVCVFNC
jgi:hypothetical protein